MFSDSLPELCEAAFLGLYEADRPSALADYGLVPQKNYNPDEDRPLPFVLFAAGIQEAKRRPQPGVHDVFLKVFISTSVMDDPRSIAHRRSAAAFLGHINDKRAVRSTLNDAGTGFHLHDYFLEGQETRAIATGEWETEITLKVVCQAVDTIPDGQFVDSDDTRFVDNDNIPFVNS